MIIAINLEDLKSQIQDTKCKADTRFSSFIVSEVGKQNAPVAQTEYETW